MQNKFSLTNNSFYIKNKEIIILLFFGICYRLLLHFFIFDAIIIENDSETYQYLAQRISDFNLENYNGQRTLGYPILIFLSNNSVQLVVLFQHILGVITSLFIYKTILNLNFSKSNSLWIVIFLQSFLNIYFYESAIIVETITLFITSILFYYITNNFINKSNFKLDVLVSFIFGYLALIKPFYAFIPFIIYGFIVLKNFKIYNIVNKRIVLLFFPMLVYFGCSYLNKINTGNFTSTTFLGYNLAQNCVYFAEKSPKKYEWIVKPYAKRRDLILKKDKNQSAAMAIWDTYCGGDYDYKKLTFADLSTEMQKYAVATIKNNPKEYVKQVVTKSWLYFWRPSISLNEKQFTSSYKKQAFNILWFEIGRAHV